MQEYSEIASSAHIAKNAVLEHPVHCAPNSQVHNNSSLGMFTFLNIGSIVYPHVTIGRYCSIARGCEIGVANHPMHFLSTHSFQYHAAQFPKYPIYKDGIKRKVWRAHNHTDIGNDVWIGAQCIVRAGVKIGHGAVIAANSVVIKDVEPYSIVGGSPAKEIKKRFDDIYIKKLLNLKWWELPMELISSLEFDNIEKCIDDLEKINLNNQP